MAYCVMQSEQEVCHQGLPSVAGYFLGCCCSLTLFAGGLTLSCRVRPQTLAKGKTVTYLL